MWEALLGLPSGVLEELRYDFDDIYTTRVFVVPCMGEEVVHNFKRKKERKNRNHVFLRFTSVDFVLLFTFAFLCTVFFSFLD